MTKAEVTSLANMLVTASLIEHLRQKGVLTVADIGSIADNAWKQSTTVALPAAGGAQVREFLRRFFETTLDDSTTPP